MSIENINEATEVETYEALTLNFNAQVNYTSSLYITADIDKETLLKKLNSGEAFMSTGYDLTNDEFEGGRIYQLAFKEDQTPYLQELARVFTQTVNDGKYGEFVVIDECLEVNFK